MSNNSSGQRVNFPESFAQTLEGQGKDIDNETTPIYISRVADVYIKSYIDDWMKQCVADFPQKYTIIDRDFIESERIDKTEILKWFDKWLGRFYDSSSTTIRDEKDG